MIMDEMHFGIINWKRRIADLQERLADLSTFLHLLQIARILACFPNIGYRLFSKNVERFTKMRKKKV